MAEHIHDILYNRNRKLTSKQELQQRPDSAWRQANHAKYYTNTYTVIPSPNYVAYVPQHFDEAYPLASLNMSALADLLPTSDAGSI